MIKYTILALTAITTSHAAVIVWEGSPTTITATTDIINDGSDALNITYETDIWPSGTMTSVATNGAINFGAAAPIINGVTFTAGGGSGPFGYATGDTDLDSVNQFHSAFGNAGDPWLIAMSGLKANTQYKIQIIGINDNRGGGISDRTTVFQDQDGGVLSPTLTRGTGGSVIGTFTTGTSETSFTIEGQGASDPGAGAIILREIGAAPEPSSTTLLGLGGLALILRRRK